MMMELGKDVITHFQYLTAANNTSTQHFRYSPTLQYDWQSNIRLPWNAYSSPDANITQPYIFETDRQVALVSAFNVTQGRYMCANGGNCVSPDVCSCSRGWMGFDCRVPICEQGYYEPELDGLVRGPKSDVDFAVFQPFLDPRARYNLDSSRNFSSNPNIEAWVEEFINASSIERKIALVNGSRYLSFDANGVKSQGGYECSIRSVTEWERPGFVLNHPNYYSRYMDQNVEVDGEVYSHWRGMYYPPTHHKTAKLFKHGREYLANSASGNISFAYSDSGYMLGGIWLVTGAEWKKGTCVVEFERRCEGAFDQVDPTEIADELSRVLVQDTDESYRPRVSYDDQHTYIDGRWFVSDEEICIDRVIRGCFNNGTCIGPNTCECSSGWTGTDCSTPICQQTCLHNGNCTLPNTCTCERGWSGEDCSIALCAQECKNGGHCIAPDTCKCVNWENNWRDKSVGGGIPLFQKPNGDPQMTGWTGECTLICV